MLTTAICSSVLCLLAAISISHVEGKPEIVKPLPLNIHPIEFEKAQVSCTIQQKAGNAKPTKIHYVRKSKYGDTDIIYDEGKKGRIYYENKTEDAGKKLTVKLHFNKVILKDDSVNGGYECHGFDGDDGIEDCSSSKTCEPYGFTVNVIGRNELPGIAVSENKTVKFGDDIVLSCNLTTKEDVQTTKLRKLMWAKDGKVIDEVLYPREQSLKSRTFKVTDPSDGGLFSCHLISKLRNIQDYNITDNIHIKVEPKFFAEELKDNEVKVFKGDKAMFECSAKGNPLKTVWKKKLKSEESVNAFDMAENSTKYEFTNLDKLEDHTLIINDVTYSDRGLYYCCIQELPLTSNNTRDDDDVKGCQMYTLRVKDPLGPLWPVIGIIIEVILLIIIVVLAEKFKKKKNQSTKTDGRVEFSYSSTDDATADKGQVRLRPSAAASSETA